LPVKINELQEKVKGDICRISTLKEVVADKYQIHQTNTATTKRKRKKNQQKEQKKKAKRKSSSVNINNANSSNSEQKLMTSFVKPDSASAADTDRST